MDFETFCRDHEIAITARQISDRPNWDTSPDYPDPVHFHVTLTIKGKPLWSGEYSQGIGIAERWAKKNLSRFLFNWDMRDRLKYGPGRNKRWHRDSDYWTQIRDQYGRAVQRGGLLSAAEVLTCLQMDISNADEKFEHWAADFGYSDDSIKARRIWEDCNTIRRDLRDALGPLFSQFQELEEA